VIPVRAVTVAVAGQGRRRGRAQLLEAEGKLEDVTEQIGHC